jgi:peptide-methionine (R)-S-oxide reductase
MNRRHFLYASGAACAAIAAGPALFGRRSVTPAMAETFPVQKTEAEWRAQLTPEQFDILRREGTEPAFSSPLLKEHRKGVFHCVGCDNALYSSETKFHSGTGWPSFYQALDGAIGTKTDHKLFMARTECHCARCGGHLGHIFDDGPPPTGKRHCIDGVALTFKPATTSS